jgi:hypothetical protein
LPQERYFPKEVKKSNLLIAKPGKEGSDDVCKFRPISLLDIGGKVLENILINTINHHVFSRGYMNENQFGFRLQKSAIDTVMAIKDSVEEGLAAGEMIALVSQNVQGAFDAAWWPGIPKKLRECRCPKSLYELTKSYFTQRTATLSTNTLITEKEISRGCPQSSCCGPGVWNLQYNSLLELKYMARTKVVAFADDLIMATRGESERTMENYVIAVLRKIKEWSRNNKAKFNDEIPNLCWF